MEPVSRVTIYGVADRAGVSAATVSRHVNGKGYVSEHARQRIDAAIAELGFRPSPVARSLSGGRSGLIGFMASDLTNPFTVEVAQAMQARAYELGWAALVCGTDGQAERGVMALGVLEDRRVDGLIVTPPETRAADAILRRLAAAGTPVVLLGRRLAGTNCDRVTADTRDGALQAVRYLIGLGHRRVGFVGPPQAGKNVAGRFRGYLDALGEAGLKRDPGLIVGASLDREGGAAALAELWRRRRHPSALVTVNDEVAVGALQEAARRSVVVPDELSVVGFDDTIVASYTVPPLSTVAQPKTDLGRRSVELIMDRLQDPDRPAREVRFGCQLVVRDSTARPRAEDANVTTVSRRKDAKPKGAMT